MNKKTITNKELFERLVTIETRLDMAAETDLFTKAYFTRMVFLIVFIQILTFTILILIK